MGKIKSTTPRIPFATSLAAVGFLFAGVTSAFAAGASGESVSVLGSIWRFIAFCIGLPISLALSIAILIGIFLAVVAMVDKEQASQMFADLKKKRTR